MQSIRLCVPGVLLLIFSFTQSCTRTPQQKTRSDLLGMQIFAGKSPSAQSNVGSPNCDPIFNEDCPPDGPPTPPSCDPFDDPDCTSDEPSDGEGNEPGDPPPPGENGSNPNIPTRNFCSMSWAQQSGTSVLSAAEGIAVAWHKQICTSGQNQLYNVCWSLAYLDSDPVRAIQRRLDLIDYKHLEVPGNILGPGHYTPILCRRSNLQACNQNASYLPNLGNSPWLGRIAPAYLEPTSVRINPDLSVTLPTPPVFGGLPLLQVLYDTSATGYGGGPDCDESYSPIMFDLDGNGITLSRPTAGVDFDIIGNGFKSRVSWPIHENDRWLALDRNNNGGFDDINELFGNRTLGPDGRRAANGYAALAKYDHNQDGIISSADPVFHQLRLWADRNRNGKSERGELSSLSGEGIISINLRFIEMLEVDPYGNQTRQRSTFERTNGRLGLTVDIWLRDILMRSR